MVIGLVDNVVVYSLWLKRRSPGSTSSSAGISGGMPVLVGYAAIADAISPLAVFMSALVIVWIPTHIWSLAIKTRQDYIDAKIPMLPVVVSLRVATVCIAITSSLLAVFSLSIFFVTTVSLFYVVSALACGAAILGYSVKLVIDRTEKTAWTLFKISSPYLADHLHGARDELLGLLAAGSDLLVDHGQVPHVEVLVDSDEQRRHVVGPADARPSASRPAPSLRACPCRRSRPAAMPMLCIPLAW